MVPRLRFSGFNDRWVKRFLSDISIITTGSTPPTSEKKFYDSNDYMFISPFDIKDTNRFINVSKNYVSELGFQEGRKLVPNTVLFVGIGSTIGKVGQIKHESITNQQIHSLIADENTSNDFIYSLLECKKNRIRLLASNQAVPQINKSDFSKLKFYFPSHKEQQKIASFISSLDNKISQLEKKKTLLETYKRGIIQRIFSQELRFKDENGQEFPKWEVKGLSEIFHIKAGGDIKKSKVSKVKTETFKYPVYSNSEKENGLYGFTDSYKFENGVITVSGRGTLGIANARFENFYPIVRLLCLIPKEEVDLIFFQHSINEIKILPESTGVPQLTAPQLSLYKVSYPPLNEQKKIASFLSSIDNKIEITSTQLEKTREFKKGLLQQMFV